MTTAEFTPAAHAASTAHAQQATHAAANEHALSMPQSHPLLDRLRHSKLPFQCDPGQAGKTLSESEVAVAIRATINRPGTTGLPGVAFFAGRRFPALVLTLEAATRLADELDEVLAAYEGA